MEDMIGNVYVPTADNRFISTEMANLVEIIRDYDPNLDLRWIPPEKRFEGELDKPYVVVETRQGKDFPVTYLTEEEIKKTEWMIASLFQWDAQRSGSRLDDLDARNAARKVLEMKKHAEELEEQADFAASVIKSPLHTYRHKGKRFDLPGAPVEVRTTIIHN